MSPSLRLSLLRAPFVLLGVSLLYGCALLGDACSYGCGSERAASTPLVSFLYPDGEVPPPAAAPVMPVPMRVGLAFVPGSYGNMPASERYAVLERIRARFASLRYVESITIVPEGYLNAASGFTGLEQVASLQGLDAVALVSLDQIARRSENDASFLYLTIIGAYLVEGSEHETHTLLDLAVVEPRSRTLLLRAAGTSALAGDATLVGQESAVARQRGRGLEVAASSLMANLSTELDSFATRVRNGTAPITVAKRGSGAGGGGGGAFDALSITLLLGLLIVLRVIHAHRRDPLCGDGICLAA